MSIQRAIIVSPKQYEGPLDADGGDCIMRIPLVYSDFLTAATTVNYDITGFPAGVIVQDAFAVLRTAFAGASVAAATLSMGSTAAPTIYGLATTVFSGAPKTVWAVNGEKGSSFTSWATAFVNAATPWLPGTIRVQLVLTGANGTALTAGKVDVFLNVRAASART